MSNELIYISYSENDFEIAKELYNSLTCQGLIVWLDRFSLKPGTKQDDEMRKAIRNSKFFLSILSKHSIESHSKFQKEVKLALSELENRPPSNNYIIPILIEEIAVPEITVGTVCLSDYYPLRIFSKTEIDYLITYLKKSIGQVIEIINNGNEKEKIDTKKIKNLISKGDIEKSIDFLINNVNDNSKILNQILILSGRFNILKNKNIQGLISHENYRVEYNNLLHGILEIVSKF